MRSPSLRIPNGRSSPCRLSLVRWQAGTFVLTELGRPLDLIPWLALQGDTPMDSPMLLGQTYLLPARLHVVRVPPEVARQRHSRLRAEHLTLQAALVLGHALWQIELLFKLWKSQGGIDESRSALCGDTLGPRGAVYRHLLIVS